MDDVSPHGSGYTTLGKVDPDMADLGLAFLQMLLILVLSWFSFVVAYISFVYSLLQVSNIRGQPRTRPRSPRTAWSGVPQEQQQASAVRIGENQFVMARAMLVPKLPCRGPSPAKSFGRCLGPMKPCFARASPPPSAVESCSISAQPPYSTRSRSLWPPWRARWHAPNLSCAGGSA